MKPDEDPSWPLCEHSGSSEVPSTHWCNLIRQHFIDGDDGETIQAGTRVCVPVLPASPYEIYAEVAIDTEVVADAFAEAFVITGTNPFDMTDEMEPIGLYTFGDGRLSLASTVQDWARGHVNADLTKVECKSSVHSFNQEMEWQAKWTRDSEYITASIWSIAVYACCWSCYVTIKSRNASGGTDVSTQWNAENFGLDTSVRETGTFTNSSRADAVRDALRNRYGR